MSSMNSFGGRLPWFSLVFVLCAEAALFPQGIPADRLELFFRFDKGRLLCDRKTARLMLSAHYRDRLRKGVTDGQLVYQFCDAIDRQMLSMPKPYFFALTDDDKKRESGGDLGDAAVARARNYEGPIERFPIPEFLTDVLPDPAGFNAALDGVKFRSGLAEYWSRGHMTNFARDPRVFRVRRTFAFDEAEFSAGLLSAERASSLLRHLEGLPGDPERIRTVFLDHYQDRGIAPRIDVDLDGSPVRIRILEEDQIAHVLLPRDVQDRGSAERILYETLPDRLFRAFRRNAAAVLQQPLDPAAQKRSIDLAELNGAIGSRRPSDPSLPFVDAGRLQAAQQRLSALGFQWSLFDFDADRRLVDLVIDRTSPQPGASTGSNPLLATAVRPGNSSGVTTRPGGLPDLAPAPLTPAAPSGGASTGSPARLNQRYFVGGGIEYRPGQGVRLLGTGHAADVAGARSLLTVEAGGQESGIATGRYSKDYFLFDQLGRRLTLNVDGGSDFEPRRILSGSLVDERRTGVGLSASLEVFRDRSGHQLSLSLSGRRETVSQTFADGQSASANLTTLDAGLAHQWERRLSAHPLKLRIEPSLRVGLGISAGEPVFSRFTLNSSYRQSVQGRLLAVVRAQARFAASKTPPFELPSLGGDQSVRGFRTDEAVGRQLWSAQNEIWVPLTRPGAAQGRLANMARNMRLAPFYDLGGLYSAEGSAEGFRQGCGAGLRLLLNGIVLELDWAYGFGEGALGDGRGRVYFNIRLP